MNINSKSNKKSEIKTLRITRLLVVLSLAGAWFGGIISRDQYLQTNLTQLYPQSGIEKISSTPLIYRNTDSAGNLKGYITTNRQQGWGGPLQVATDISPEGKIQRVHVLQHQETPSFYLKLTGNKFFGQFIDREVTSPFIVDRDIDAVTRATISSKGFTRSIRVASHDVAREVLHLSVKEEKQGWKFGAHEIILLLLFSLVVFGSVWKKRKLRYFTMAGGLVFLGFYLNFPLSISQISSIFLGYFPIPGEYLFWWLLVGGIFLMIMVFGKNLYCYWLCPFGALQEFLHRISGISIKFHPAILKYGRHLAPSLAWLSLMIIFISRNPAMGSYEPFAAIFSFEGIGIIWYILPVILFSSFFIRRFWCRFFCPVGAALDTGCRTRNRLVKTGGRK